MLRLDCFFRYFSVFFILTFSFAGCSHLDEDRYLLSLKLAPEYHDPIDSIDIEQFNWHMPLDIIKIDGRFVIKTDMRDYCLSMITSEGKPMDLIRIGRGPGEIIQCPSLQLNNDRVVCYDSTSGVLVSVDVEKSEQTGITIVDTLGIYSKASEVGCLKMTDKCYLCIPMLDGEYWYVSSDKDGNRLSGVKTIDFPEIKNMSLDMKMSFLYSSIGTVGPKGDKVCYASVASATLSFSEIKDGILTEIKRYSYNPPLLAEGGQAFSMDSCNGFESLFSNDDYVFALYSGKPISSTESPSWECNHLLVYDWAGILKKYYYLSQLVKSVWVEGDILYATTTYPEAKILIYKLI